MSSVIHAILRYTFTMWGPERGCLMKYIKQFYLLILNAFLIRFVILPIINFSEKKNIFSRLLNTSVGTNKLY